MNLSKLTTSRGSSKKAKRVGRGNASGRGTYSTRGVKGQNARSGGGVRLGFEGGQTPLLSRIPKLKGFKNHNREEFTPLNLAVIEAKFEADSMVSPESLNQKGIITKKGPIKILGQGELTKALTFTNFAFSESAKEKITKAKGKIEQEIVTKKEPKKSKK
jgi:large subunit ribosomal protein L15